MAVDMSWAKLIMYLLIPLVMYWDACRLRRQRVRIIPLMWGVAGLVLNIFAMLVYCLRRMFIWMPQPVNAEGGGKFRRWDLLVLLIFTVFIILCAFSLRM